MSKLKILDDIGKSPNYKSGEDEPLQKIYSSRIPYNIEEQNNKSANMILDSLYCGNTRVRTNQMILIIVTICSITLLICKIFKRK